MLQDVEAGKAVEANALIGAVVELGELTKTPTPHISSIYACIKLLSKTMVEERISIKGQSLQSRPAKSRLHAV